MNRSAAAASEWRANWTVVLAALAGTAVSTINAYSTGVFMEPLQAAFGWSRAEISFAMLINAAFCVVCSPFVGAAADRFGPRWIGLPGAVVLCSLTAALGLVGPSIYSWWAMFVLISLANLCIVPMIWTSAVTATFNAGRGLALAVALSGTGLGALVTPALSVYLIGELGWRAAFPALAGFWALIVIPLLALFFRTRKKKPLASGAAAAPKIALAAVVRSDMLNWRFLRLGIATLLIASVAVSFSGTIFPILSSVGLDRAQAAGIASILGIASICGRLTVGALLDRFEARFVAAAAVMAPVVACVLLLAVPGSVPVAALAVIFLGFALGAELDVVSYLTSRLFDTRHFGMLFGAIVSFITLAGGLGPFLVNSIFDWTGSYRLALMIAIPMCMASALLFLSMRLPPREHLLETETDFDGKDALRV